MAVFKTLCLTLCTYMLTAIHQGDSKERRADDVDFQSVMSLVQQQAATIQRQEASLQALQSQVTTPQQTVSNLTTQLDHVTGRQDTQISFMAQITQTPVDMGTSRSPFKFDHVVSNVGGAYNPASGVFSAPVSGTYVFYVQLMKNANHHTLYYVIEKSGTEICVNSLDDLLTYDKSSCLTVVPVQKGQQVFVRQQAGDTWLEGNLWCSFAGFLLSSDA